MSHARPLEATKPKKRRLRPIEARTFSEICSLPRDGYDTKHFWLLIDMGQIVLCEQVTGEKSTNTMKIPRAEFDRLARWYVTGKAAK